MISIFILSLVWSVFSDCPVASYPRQTVTGKTHVILGVLTAQINNNPRLHSSGLQYNFSLSEPFQQGSVNVAISVVGLQFNPFNSVNFNVQHLPITLTNLIKFRVTLQNPSAGWTSFTFGFFATQSPLFLVSTQFVNQFSVGTDGKNSVYRPILNFNNYQNQPVIFVSINGLDLKSKPIDEQYNLMSRQFESFKKFSSNIKLVANFAQALEQKKAIAFRVLGTKLLGRVLTFGLETNTEVKSLKFSYILFSNRSLLQKHSFIQNDFFLVNGNQYRFTGLSNMNMVFTTLLGFKVPRDQFYSFKLTFDSYLGQSYFDVETNFRFFSLDFSFIAFQTKQKFICQDCKNSPTIFDNRFCVQTCPRGFSKMQRLENFYCQKCDIQKLMVVDTTSGQCVCAKRHFYQSTIGSCRPCSYDCMTCSDSNRCLTCDNNLLQTKRRLNSNGRCQCPPIGFYDDKNSEDIVCQKCDSKCVTCNGPKYHDCLSCSAGKDLTPLGICVCKNGLIQDTSGNCACNPPRVFSNGICFDTKAVCNQNQIQQFIQGLKRCVCKPGTISVGDNCIRCGPNSVFDQKQLTCLCVNRTVFLNNSCVPCGQDQVYDENNKICVCRPGTFKIEQGKCVNCPPKMAIINGKCECIFSYFQKSPGVCQRCLRQTDGPKCKRNPN